MASWLERAAAMHPERVAIADAERELTYRRLLDAASGAAAALQRLGVRPGDRLGLALPGVEFVIAVHGCLLAGAVAVPIDLRLTEAERRVRAAGARLVVTEPLAHGPFVAPTVSDESDQVLAVLHTSGTTAAPKPVELTRRNFTASALGSAVALGLDREERWLCPMPLVHVGGLSIPIRSAIYATTAVIRERFDAEAVATLLSDASQRITLVSLVPTMLARLLDAGLSDPPTLRWALLGGGPIPAPLLERAAGAGVPVAPTYGMTEACSQIATFGWPLTGAQVRTAGDGEILVRGPIVAPGAVADDEWLHTGDAGAFDERGRLAITGRLSDTVITGGENVAPAEVEEVLLAHPAVAEAAVHGRRDGEWGESLVATVVLGDGRHADPAELRAHCAAQLPAFKVPKAIELAERLPRSPSGKLLRRELS